MPKIDLETTIPDPQTVVVPRLRTVVTGYAARHDAPLELDGGRTEAGVPVVVTVAPAVQASDPVEITLEGARRGNWYPSFEGSLRSVATGSRESTLRLSGTYRTPRGTIGSMVDQTLLTHAAERSLRLFLDRVRGDLIAEFPRAAGDVADRRTSAIDRRSPEGRRSPR